MSIINWHTCIGDDGGTPNRKCQACEKEKNCDHVWTRVGAMGVSVRNAGSGSITMMNGML